MVYRLAQIQLASARQLRKLANRNSASCASIWATRGVACRPQYFYLRDEHVLNVTAYCPHHANPPNILPVLQPALAPALRLAILRHRARLSAA
jgi:hypothetical protein